MADEWKPEIFGLKARPLPEGYTPLEADVVIKCLDENGEVTVLTRGTDGLNIWDSIGMLSCSLAVALVRAVRGFDPDDDADDEDDQDAADE